MNNASPTKLSACSSKVFGSATERSASRLDEGARLIRPHGLAEELVDRVQVDRHRIDLVPARRLDPVGIGHEALEAVDVIPDLAVIGMKDVRAVDMHHHACFGIALGMAIAGDMAAGVEDLDLMPGERQFAADHGAGKTCADNGDLVLVGHLRGHFAAAASAVQRRLSKAIGAKSWSAFSLSR